MEHSDWVVGKRNVTTKDGLSAKLIVRLLHFEGQGEAVTLKIGFPKGYPLAHDFAEQSER